MVETPLRLARATAGREAGKVFALLDTSGGAALLADGKMRKLEKPKKKNLRHLELIAPEEITGMEGFLDGEITNRQLRKALAVYKAGAQAAGREKLGKRGHD